MLVLFLLHFLKLKQDLVIISKRNKWMVVNMIVFKKKYKYTLIIGQENIMTLLRNYMTNVNIVIDGIFGG